MLTIKEESLNALLDRREAERDAAIARAEKAEAELAKRPLDEPSLDATDGAHPAWWRGCDDGCKSASRVLLRILERGHLPGHGLGSPEIAATADAILKLLAERDAAREELRKACVTVRNIADMCEQAEEVVNLEAAEQLRALVAAHEAQKGA